MTRLRVLCAAVALVCASGQVLAATASHNAAAEKFLTLTNADKLGTPVYMQVQQMFAQRFARPRPRPPSSPYWKATRPRPMPRWTTPSAGTS
ncbi:hypothetical protein PshuTeo2_43880 [Pseudomonas hunanensis]|nr:hypothetical protein [Pseudomonas hunanensis]